MSAALTTNVDVRQLRATKFPPIFNEKVDMTRVNTPIIKKWITDAIEKILGNDDDVVTELVNNMIEKRYPNIKELQIALTGFLDKDAASFCLELWKLCLSAQQNPQGIPRELLEAKKQELAQTRLEEERAREEARSRQAADFERARDRARIREGERTRREEHRGRGGRNGRRYDRPPRFQSRSPPPRRRRDGDDFYRTQPAPRGDDLYRPSDRPRRTRSRSFSRSPPAPTNSRRRSGSIRSYSPIGRSRERPGSPYRRRRRVSEDRSLSRNRRRHRTFSRERRVRSRSPLRKRPRERSPSTSTNSSASYSPRHRRRRGSSIRPHSNVTPSRSRSRSPKPMQTAKDSSHVEDLMIRSGTHKHRTSLDNGRLSREFSDRSITRSAASSPRRDNTSSSDVKQAER